MLNIEKLILKYKLTKSQISKLYKTFTLHIIDEKSIKKGYFLDKYKTFKLEYFIKEVKKDKNPEDIIFEILDICAKYERKKIISSYLIKLEYQN